MSMALRRRYLPLIAKVTAAPTSAITFITRANESVTNAPLNAVTEPVPDFQITKAATATSPARSPPRIVEGVVDFIITPSSKSTMASIASAISGRAAAKPNSWNKLMRSPQRDCYGIAHCGRRDMQSFEYGLNRNPKEVQDGRGIDAEKQRQCGKWSQRSKLSRRHIWDAFEAIFDESPKYDFAVKC